MNDWSWITQGLKLVIPELILLGSVLAIVLLDLFKGISKKMLALIAAGACIAALAAAVEPSFSLVPQVIFKGSAAHDGLTIFFKAIFAVLGLVTVVYSWPVVSRWPSGQGEFLSILLSCTFGMMIMAAANDLLMMFLALEFVSVTSYIMTSVLRRNRRSAEASLKYIIYGSAAAGVMLYGMSYLYGLTGSLNVGEIGRHLPKNLPSSLGLIVSVMISGGFAYKIAAAPFHMWCPDVYEGAATPVTAFFSVGPKLAGFAMFARFLWGVFPQGAPSPFEWKLVIAAMAILTMAFGNFGALYQNNLKRLLAYSGIAHAGYMLLAFVVFDPTNIASLLFYAVAYFFMNLGAFLVVLVLEEKYGIETVDGCRGMGWVDPKACVCMAVFLFSLVGIPPLAGFTAKVMIFGYIINDSVVNHNALGATMAVIGVIFSAISLYYYARILAQMFLSQPASPPAPQRTTRVLDGLVWIMAAGTFLIGIWYGWLYDLAKAASTSMLRLP